MIKSRTSSISHTPNPSLLTSAALRASKPSPSGARFRRSLPRSEERPLVLAGLSVPRFSPLKLTVPGGEIVPAPARDLEIGEVSLPELVGRRGLVLERLGRFD